eukprot:3819531-Prymnesium_polylepis.3
MIGLRTCCTPGANDQSTTPQKRTRTCQMHGIMSADKPKMHQPGAPDSPCTYAATTPHTLWHAAEVQLLRVHTAWLGAKASIPGW